jgi:hypothetical protein
MLDTHVDDLALAYRNDLVLACLIQFFAYDNCVMNDLGGISQFLGIEVQRECAQGYIQITQAGFVK